MAHSSRSRQELPPAPIMRPPEHTQEKLPGVLTHLPPLHGSLPLLALLALLSLLALLLLLLLLLAHSSTSTQVRPSSSSSKPVEHAHENEP